MQTNSELIRAVIDRNDQNAFAQLVLRYERLVWTVAWRELGDYHATQDVTQETFLVAHGRLSELRDPNAIGSWLSTIAQREAGRARRGRKETRPIEVVDSVVDDSARAVPSQHDGLIVAIADLPEHERTVTVLRYLGGHSVAEVAALTGRPVGTVTKQLSRAIGRLRTSMVAKEQTGQFSLRQSGTSHVQS